MTTQSIRNSIALMVCVVAALAIFTSPVHAERLTVGTPIQVQLQVPGCNVNGFVTLSGTIILDTEFRVILVRSFVNAQVRPDVKAITSAAVYRVEGTTDTQLRQVAFLNGLATLTFPGSFKVESGTVRFEIQYTAHLTFKRQVGKGVSLVGVVFDNFQVVCL